MNKIYIRRCIAPACGKWNYNIHDDTFIIPDPYHLERKVKVSATYARDNGWIIRGEQ